MRFVGIPILELRAVTRGRASWERANFDMPNTVPCGEFTVYYHEGFTGRSQGLEMMLVASKAKWKRARSAARPRPPLSLPRLRGSGSRLGRAVSRGGAEPRARATAVGTAHALGRGPSRNRSARPWVIGAHGRDTVETRVRGRDADIGPYATAVPLVPNHEQDHESTGAINALSK